MTRVDFNIKEPYWLAWLRYGWDKEDWGIGLNKKKIDSFFDDKVISIFINTSKQFFDITVSKVRKCPTEMIRNSDVEVYIVKRSELHLIEEKSIGETSIEELAKMGVF